MRKVSGSQIKFRRLDRTEHERSRALYEEVFSEDEKAFVDYYYEWKVRDNLIYVAEDGNVICAMVQLNPFRIYLKGGICTMHYIVAVATKPEYRHQGLMRRLLNMAESEVKEAGEPFLFLMPASEEIYLPFGYRFFCEQRCGVLRSQPETRLMAAELSVELPAVCQPVQQRELGAVAQFVNGVLARSYEMFVYRDAAYYVRLCEEQRCQGGAVMVIRSAGELIGTFCTAQEPSYGKSGDKKSLCLREVILDPERHLEAQRALLEFIRPFGECKVEGCQAGLLPDEEAGKPFLMGKVPGGSVCDGGLVPGELVFINETV